MIAYTEAVLTGLSNALSLQGLLIITAGTLVAMTTSFLPGVGSASLMSIVLLSTLAWSQESILLLFGALVGGATFMGSITAILFNIPGSPPNAAALMDGYPLAKKGYPRTAIACAATATGLGSIVGVAVLLTLLPFLNLVVPQLGSWERLLLGVWGLASIVALPTTSISKSLTMCALGLLLALVGADPINATHRFTFGIDALVQGVSTIPMLIGLFTLAEIIRWRDTSHESSWSSSLETSDSTWAGIQAVIREKWLTLRSSLLGTVIGIIPGIGGTAAGFISYGQAQAFSKDSSQFGQGDIRGLIAPEAAMDAKDGGSLLPAIALGIPGSEAGIFLLTALLLHGVVPGTPMLDSQLHLTTTLVFALLVSNLLTSLVGIAAAPQLAKLHNLPLQRAALPLILVCLLLVLHLNGSVSDVYTAILFGLIGYGFKKWRWPVVPLVIAFILGEYLERNLGISMRLIELGRIEPLQRPIGLIVILMIVASLLFVRMTPSKLNFDSRFQKTDLVVALPLFAISSVFLFISLAESYSAITLAVASVVWISSVFALVNAIRSFSSEDFRVWIDQGLIGVRSNQALLLLAAFPLLLWLLGFHVAVAAAVMMTAMKYKPVAALRFAVTAGVAMILGLSSYYFVSELNGLVVPAGLLFSFDF